MQIHIHHRICIHLLVVAIAVTGITSAFLLVENAQAALVPAGGKVLTIIPNTYCPTSLSPAPGVFVTVLTTLGPKYYFVPAGFQPSAPKLCYIGFMVPGTCGLQPASIAPPLFGVAPCK